MPEHDQESPRLSRRSLIAGAALVPVAALTSAVPAPAAPAGAQTVFSPSERRTLEAFVGRLVPSDELGPGALECGAINYIEQALAGALADEKASFLQGLAEVDTYARKVQDAGFAELPPEKRDGIIAAMEQGTAANFPNARAVFARFRRLTLEGMFSDPYYGGNTDFRGWEVIRYPGPRVAVAPEDQQMKVAIQPYRRSALGANNGH
ncbi:MAG TPA: gluconate 2-dehydrogenase subunit 3 family protein [Bryobacteraceae bacterium]|nr:gluconate 2-dehydrogenase subunit 3 family protein [Bryobacteraceae bacterium]